MRDSDKFTIVRTSCDGASMEFLTRTILEKRLNENYYGEDCKFSPVGSGLHSNIGIDLQAQSGFWIIPGWPIVPEVKVVKTSVVLP